jgi:hypothetical protein
MQFSPVHFTRMKCNGRTFLIADFGAIRPLGYSLTSSC